jgi:hypothetical protein
MYIGRTSRIRGGKQIRSQAASDVVPHLGAPMQKKSSLFIFHVAAACGM